MQNRSRAVMSVHHLVTIVLVTLLVVIPNVSFAAGVPYLDSLTVAEAQITPAFRPTTLFYNVSVGQAVANLNITASPQDADTTVSIDGNTALQPGVNTIKITLTSPSQQTQTYVLTVNKAGTPASGNVDLKLLSVGPWTLTPNFSPDVTDYSTDVDPRTENLDVVAKTVDPNATTAITGSVGLETGMNTVQITVSSSDGSKTKVYTIAVNKLPEAPKSTAATSTETTPTNKSATLWYLAAAAVIAAALIAFIVAFIRRRRCR